MPIPELNSAFVQAANEGHIGGDILPLMGKLVAVLGVQTLPVVDGTPRQPGDWALLTGVTQWPQPSEQADTPTWTLTLLGTVNDQGRDVLTLEMLARTDRAVVPLGALLPADSLPQSRVNSSTLGGVTTLGPSVLTDLGPKNALVTARAVDDNQEAEPPGLSGELVLSETDFATYASVLGDEALSLTGTFDPRADAETSARINLEAVAPNADTAWWSKLNVESVSLLLTTDYRDAYSLEHPPAFSSAVLLALNVLVETELLANDPHAVQVTVAPSISSEVWDLRGSVSPPLPLASGVVALLKLFPGAPADTFQLPTGVAALDAFGLSNLNFGIETIDLGGAPVPTGITYSGATVVSTTPWDLPIPFMSLEKVGASWMVAWAEDSLDWRGTLFGTMRFGAETGDGAELRETPTDEDVLLNVTVSLPGLSVKAVTEGPIALPLSDAMNVFFPGTQPTVGSLVVDRITMGASLTQKTFGATLHAEGDWGVAAGNISFLLVDIDFSVTVSPSAVWGGLSGMVGVFQADDEAEDSQQLALLSAGAYYPGDGSWSFEGGLAQEPLDLIQFVSTFWGEPPPEWLLPLSVELTGLWATYATTSGNPYSVSAALAVIWDPELLGITLAMEAEADLVYRRRLEEPDARARHDALLPSARRNDSQADMVYEGSVRGAFTVNNLTVTAGVSFMSNVETWLFRVDLDRFVLDGRSEWTGAGDGRHQVITVEMQGVNLGELISSFAALANPNTNYRLQEPWTFLNDIHLGRFTLVVDPSKQSVRFEYEIKLKLGFVTIKSVGVHYARETGEPKVDIQIKGNFLGTSYGDGPEKGSEKQRLAWDALNDSPPAVPGKGGSLVNLRYLGLGQHVSLSGLTRADSLAEVMTLLRAQMKPQDSQLANPLTQPSGDQLQFDEGSQWLIGLDVTLMNTVSVQLVMQDPDLYGVLIGLAGAQAGVLAGFRFELLYKKVTADIGVFKARLQVPDAFRRLDFGAVALTLGVIAVDVYTNGNFKVDFGFPHGRDFSQSFGLQYGPFLGKGGIYFGLLNGETSTKVPAIDNGEFSPVLELGVGLAVGVGREINRGVLAATLTVQLEVVFEGVLAWFHPDDASASEAMYYAAQGTAALVGKLYGKVDFKVIAVDISLDAYAAITVQWEACRRTLIDMKIGVRAHAVVKVAFVDISFDFEVQLDTSFAVGADSTPPWVLAGGASATRGMPGPLPVNGGIRPLDRASRTARVRKRRRRGDLARFLRAARTGSPLTLDVSREGTLDPFANYTLDFSPATQVYADGVQSLDARAVLGLTIADLPVAWPGGSSGGSTSDPAYRVVLMLTIDGPGAAEADTLEETRRGAFTPTARTDNQEETPFATLAEGLFRWAVSAVGCDPQTGTLDAAQVDVLAAQLRCPETFAEGFSFTNVSEFFANNLVFRISGDPAGGEPATIPGVCLPVPPVLLMKKVFPTSTKWNFATDQPMDDEYAALIDAYFRELSPRPFEDAGPDPASGIVPGESLASVVFREYMLLITQLMVQQTQNLFESFPVEITGADTLTKVAAEFPTATVPYVVREGDTVAQVAETYGCSAQELLALNPELAATLAAAT
ncbi:LysM peptidoglycan-binding domain-containing protein, partial [Planctomycetota bacterium]|nr:LysM peptidoglycan-binding domain-containing protein [Planctomycetota bacterium]